MTAMGRLKSFSAGGTVYIALIFCFLFCSFRWDVFGIEKDQVATNIVLADVYIVPALHYYAEMPGIRRDLGEIQFLGGNGNYFPYVMQVGLQRILYSFVSPRSVSGVDRAVPYLRDAIAALLALTFTGFAYFVKKEFGLLVACAAAAMLGLSNWLIVFAPDLFWVCATFFIPFVLAALLGDPSRSAPQQRLLGFLFFASCFIKCLCGYDYVTNIFGAAAAPLLYHGLRRGVTLYKIAARVLRFGLLSIVAFCLAILCQMLQFVFVGRNAPAGISSFVSEVRRRTLSDGEGIGRGYDDAVFRALHMVHIPVSPDGVAEHYLSHLRPLLRYFRYLGMAAFSIPLPSHSLRVPIGLLVVGFVALIWLRRNWPRYVAGQGGVDRKTAWIWSTLAALLISHFWIVAANGHMTHTFFNAIVFYIPFLPMAYVVLANEVISRIPGAPNRPSDSSDMGS